MVLVQKFFCFDLYTTGLLVGWLGLAESITSCIFSILMLENIEGMIRPEDFPTENIQQIRWSKTQFLKLNIKICKPIELIQHHLREHLNHFSGFDDAWDLHCIQCH